MPKIFAPFTPEQVKHLNNWQQTLPVHPFTCGTKEKHKEGDEDRLIPTKDGWICLSCDYKQNWAHDYMAKEVKFSKEFTDIFNNSKLFNKPQDNAKGYDEEVNS